jgi:large subunit ribosomal protein L19
MHPVISQIEKEYLKKSKLPDFQPGDTVRLSLKVKEGDKERLQAFEGVVISRKNGGLRETFTVRRVSFGIGVERTFFVHSPVIEKFRLVRRGKVRRAKLYYLRGRGEKQARIEELMADQTPQTNAGATANTPAEQPEATAAPTPEPTATV